MVKISYCRRRHYRRGIVAVVWQAGAYRNRLGIWILPHGQYFL